MEDGDTESYQVSSMIQDFLFLCRKGVVSMDIFDRYRASVCHNSYIYSGMLKIM